MQWLGDSWREGGDGEMVSGPPFCPYCGWHLGADSIARRHADARRVDWIEERVRKSTERVNAQDQDAEYMLPNLAIPREWFSVPVNLRAALDAAGKEAGGDEQDNA